MATVYDKSSLFLAPSGVSNGTVFVQKPVPIYGSEQVTNGDFSQTGAEQVTNGDFATDSDWTKQTSWSISGGAANYDFLSDSKYIRQTILNGGFVAGKTYRINFEVTSGSAYMNFNSNSGVLISVNTYEVGSYSIYVSPSVSASDLLIYGRNTSGTAFSIDNVSVKEVGQDWTLGTGWSIGGDKAVAVSGTASKLRQTNTLNGKICKVTLTVSDYSSGLLIVDFGSTSSATMIANGDYVFYGTYDQDNFEIYKSADFIGSITNISVQEVLSPDGDFTFTRGSNLSATRVNEAQLIEKGRENVLLQSNQFDTTWQTINASVTSGQSGYDGSSNAWELDATAAGGRVYQNISSSGVHTFSIYAKKGTADGVRVRFVQTTDTNVYIDLRDGTLSFNPTNTIDVDIQDVSNGWYRITFALNAIGMSILILYTTDGTSSQVAGSIYIQDTQLEQGLAASPYIPTTTTSAQAGLLENTPRLDYSGGATCPSLLLEPQRTNLIAYSEYWNDWQEVRTTLSFNEATSPEGIQNASLLVDSVDLNTHISQAIYNTSSGTTPVTWSLFAKKQNNRYISLRLQDDAANASGNTNYIVANYDLESGVVTDTLESGSPTNAIADIEDYGNGWYRLIISMTKKSGVTRTDTQIRLCKDGTAKAGEAFAGTGNDGNYIYGLQLEEGSYPTSYIPNHSGGTITRGADRAQILNTTTDVLSQTAFTLFFEADLTSDTTNNFRDIVAFRGASKELRFETRTDNSVRVQSNMITSGDSFNSAIIGDTDNKKFAMTFTTSQVRLYADGSLVSTYNGAYSSDLVHILFMNSTSLGVETKTNFKQYILFSEALTDADCISLTTL